MRLFIAISLSPEIRGALRKVQDEMFDRGVRGNFTPEANMHLTLAFIGDLYLSTKTGHDKPLIRH